MATKPPTRTSCSWYIWHHLTMPSLRRGLGGILSLGSGGTSIREEPGSNATRGAVLKPTTAGSNGETRREYHMNLRVDHEIVHDISESQVSLHFLFNLRSTNDCAMPWPQLRRSKSTSLVPRCFFSKYSSKLFVDAAIHLLRQALRTRGVFLGPPLNSWFLAIFFELTS